MKSLKKALLTSTCFFLIGNSAFCNAAAESPSQSTSKVQQTPAGVLPDPNEDSPFYSLKCCWIKEASKATDEISLGDGSHWRIDSDYLEEVNTWETGDPLFSPLTTHPFQFLISGLKIYAQMPMHLSIS